MLGLVGGAGVLTSISGPRRLRGGDWPWMEAFWRGARKWGFVMLIASGALLLLSLL